MVDREYCPVCTYPVAYPLTVRRPVICAAHVRELKRERRAAVAHVRMLESADDARHANRVNGGR